MVKSGRKLFVAEMFSSIQGESSYAGLPCTFIRLAGCNLNCVYCDTVYAREGGKVFSLDRIIKFVRKQSNELVCVTGGEPLLQDAVRDLIAVLIEMEKRVIVETNGSMPINKIPSQAIRVVDVKTPASGEAESFYMRNLEEIKADDEIKFVVCDKRDFVWALDFIKSNTLEKKCKLLISPAYGLVTADKAAKWILDSGLDLRLNIQLHKVIWGADARGV